MKLPAQIRRTAMKSSPVRSDEALGSEPVPGLLLRLSLPAAFSMMINALYNLVDAIFVGQAAGPYAIAALAVAFPVQQIVMAFGQMYGQGAASIVSRALGSGRRDLAGSAAGTAITMAFLTIAILSIAGIVFLNPVLRMFGANQDVLPYGRDYLSLILLSAPLLAAAMAGNNLLRAEGKMVIAMTTMLVGAVMNLILDPILIFGFGMGIRGAAIATAISQTSSFLFIAWYYATGRSGVGLKLHHMIPRPGLIKESAALGLPIFVRQGANSVIATLINNLLLVYGTAISIAVYGTVNRLLMFMFMPMFGLVQAFQPVVGYNYGAGNNDRVRHTVRLTIGVLFIYGAAATLIMVSIPAFLFRLFTTDDALVREGVPALRAIVAMLPLIGIQIVGSTFFQSIGRARPAVILGLLRQVILLIPFVIFLPMALGLQGIWLAFPAADLIATIVTAVFLIRGMGELSAHTLEPQPGIIS